MAPPILDALHRRLRRSLGQALARLAGALVLVLLGLTAAALALAAGVMTTAGHIGTAPALFAWSGGLALVVLITVAGWRVVGSRRRPAQAVPRPQDRSPATLPATEAGFRAGLELGQSLSPLAVAAVCFVVGARLAQRTRR